MPAQMTFRPSETPLRDLLEEIHRGELQLPDFQRSWVWDDDRIRDLLASVSQAWPVGAVLLLECGGEVRFKARTVEGAPANAGRERRLILDGQQRLTSLYATLRSGNAARIPDGKGGEIDRVYYFDIRRCLDEGVERKEAILSLDPSRQVREDFNRKVTLDLSTPEKEYEALCIPVATVFDFAASQEWQFGMSERHQHAAEIARLFHRFQREVALSVQQYRVPSIELGRDTSRRAVCMVFEKLNTGGKPLDVFELVTATYAASEHDLRGEWARRKERLAPFAILKDFESTDFLQSVTLLASWRAQGANRRVGCKRDDILGLPLERYRACAEEVERGLFAAARLLERERVYDHESLPYLTQLIPLAAIAAALGPRFHDAPVREKILRWYWCGVFGELYSGAVETRYGRDMVEVPAWVDGGEEPSTVRDCNFVPLRLRTLTTRNSAAFKGLEVLLLHCGARDPFSAEEVTPEAWRAEEYDLAFVFQPKDFHAAGDDKLARSALNRLALSKRSARRLGSVLPSVWIQRVERSGLSPERVDEILRSHAIDPALARRDDAAALARDRARRLLDGIERLTGKAINGRESDETVRAFGGALPPSEPDAPTAPTERLFGQYEVIEAIGGCGMAEGYKVRGPDGVVAFLKKVAVEGIGAEALRREIDVYNRLHRAEAVGVLRVLGVERNDTHVALLTEFADGGTLRARVESQRGALEPAEAKEVGLTVLTALRELHGLDVVHRDLKPDNVLRVDGRWKLADFGIAKNLRRLVTQNRTFQGMGTMGYAPLEQVDGAEAHPSADVYAFGKLLVFLLTGQTDVDKLMLPSWAKVARQCTALDPALRPTLDEVETALSAIHV
ncbi:MAG: DUF262 domain-containing protein [Polyangiales bacterium]